MSVRDYLGKCVVGGERGRQFVTQDVNQIVAGEQFCSLSVRQAFFGEEHQGDHNQSHVMISFALDDFGTGDSSLAYLKCLPLDQLKIDQSFVRDALSDPNNAITARAVVNLGQSLGLAVIAEGVETEAQHEFLAANNCLACQGCLFDRPEPVPNAAEPGPVDNG